MEKVKKVSVIGIGGVGTNAACFSTDIAQHVVIYNRKRTQDDERVDGICRDMYDAVCASTGCRITGTNSYEDLADSDYIAITIGLGREYPYETRDMLFFRNASLIKSCLDSIYNVSPNARIIISTNPVDYMGAIALKAGFNEGNILCLGGEVDKARLARLICDALQTNAGRYVSPEEITDIYVLGSHGPTMIPVFSNGKFEGKPLGDILDNDTMEKIVKGTRSEGATITKKRGKSAIIGPGAAMARMISRISKGEELLAHTFFQVDELKQLGVQKITCDKAFLGLPFKIVNNEKRITKTHMSDSERSALEKFIEGQNNRDNEVETILSKTQEGLSKSEMIENFIGFMKQKGVIIKPLPEEIDKYETYKEGDGPESAVAMNIKKYIG